MRRQRAHLERLHEEGRRHHATLRAHFQAPSGPVDAATAARFAELDRLHAEGERLHAEDQRLYAERERGVLDLTAHDRFFAALAAHREALRRFRTGG